MNRSLLKALYMSVLFLMLFLTTQLSAAIVGTTKGEFSVNQGTASYSLKIDVPPGVSGMEPKLSLNYNSGGGNGYMGVGWSIGGVSAITRCPQTKAVDGARYVHGIHYDERDRYCLDGQRLIVVKGTYGADSSEYRTEIDTYSKITQKGIYHGSYGPHSFEVKTKSGLTYRYGLYGGTSGDASAYLVINKRKVFWKVNDITDTFGNKIVFHYKNNYATGENYLDKVTYADNTIDYVYEDRPDTHTSYSGGHVLSMTKRLKAVIVKTGSTEVRRYKIAYTNEPSGAKRSKVASITEHVAEGDLRKLEMTYQPTDGKLKMSSKVSPTTSKDAHYVDLNGDGCIDAYINNKWTAGDCKGGWSRWKDWKSKDYYALSERIRTADFDGDGDMDFWVESLHKDPWRIMIVEEVYLNDGNGNFVANSGILCSAGSMSKVADFNHDGKMDFLIRQASSQKWEIYLKKRSENRFARGTTIQLSTKNVNEIILQDLNSDGLVDIYEVNNGNDIIHINNGNMTFTKKSVPIHAQWNELKFSDLNGDGFVDIYQVASGTDKIWINDGKGNFVHKYSPNVDASSKDLRLVDLNGDGYPDLYDVDSGNDNIWLNDGKGDFPAKTYELPVFCSTENLHFVDIDGDGIKDMIEADGTNKIWFNQAKKPLLTCITNHTDQDIRISYKPMTDPAVYYNYSTHGKRNKYAWNNIANDNIEVTTSRPLVYSVNSANGVGGFNQIRYKYFGYIINKLRGSQGFHAIYTYDDTSKMLSGTFYKQIEKPNGEGFQYTGMPYMSYSGREYGAAWGKWLSNTNIIYKDASTHTGSRAKIYEPYTYSNVQTIYDPNTKAEIKKVYHNNYLYQDGLGNISKTVDRTEDKVNGKNFYKTTYNYYDPADTEKWYIGRLNRAKVVHTQTDGGTVTRTSTFKYDKDTGVLTQEVANAGTPLALTKSYVYDKWGNKIKETISGAGIATATTTFGYSSDGKFQTKVTNAAGLSEYKTYDARFGTLKTLKGPNGLTTTWTYDGMGRKIFEKRADGTWHKWEHLWYRSGNINSRYLYWVKETQSGTSYNTATYYDSLGRETSKHVSTLGGKRILRYKYYNAKGELYKETLPYINRQDTPSYIITTYDKYGRPVKVSKPGANGTTQTYQTSYSNFTQIVTDPKGTKKQTVKNAIDQTIKVTDAYGTSLASSITYKYDAAGNLLRTTDAAGNVITMQYDAAGNKSYMKDPDLGVWYYRYNAAGKLTKQWSGTAGFDGSKNATYKKYDILGRLIQTNTYNRIEYLANKQAYTYNYKSFKYGDKNAAVGSRGKLIEAYASSKINKGDWHAERKTYTYDKLGRPKSTNTYIYGRGDYLVTTTYDAYSRPSTITYPNGYKITNHYSNGILDYVKGSDGKVHYKINDLDAFGQVDDATYGNGVHAVYGYDSAGYLLSLSAQSQGHFNDVQQMHYSYDVLGNVIARIDSSIAGKTIEDRFGYDAMNRLTSVRTTSDVKGSYAKSKSYRYDKLGNITYQSGIGNYSYYAGKPHALKSAGNRSYTYDEVGNMTHRNGDTITYNPLNKPAILKNHKNGKEVRFYYGVGGARYMKRTAQRDTYYIGKAYEEQVEDNTEKQICYITIGGKTIGTHVEIKDTDYVPTNPHYNEATYNRYFHTDALGSITAITDDKGKVVERRSYEPFGKIRAMDYGTNNNTLADITTQTTRAFTGHEQIAEIPGLIHMNARLYDSEIGRFLSADTIIQDPHDSQAYNRYSYVRNNPMVYTDPSGHSWFSKLWKKIKSVVVAVVVAIVAVYTAGAVLGAFGYTAAAASSAGFSSAFAMATALGDTAALIASGAAAGFAAGVAGGLLSGASLGQSLRMGLKGAVFGAIGAGVANVIGSAWGGSTTFGAKAGRAILHGLSRAAISKAQGGRWSAGFWSGFASSALSPLTGSASTFEGKVAMSAIVGGTAAELGGGKFANGAVSAAFVMMYNEMGHSTYPSKDKFLYVKDRIALNRDALLAGAQDGHLTLDEAIAWYRYGNGAPVTVNGNLLSTACIGSHCFVTGNDYWVHGQVSINPTNGRIYDQYFDFEMHGRNFYDDGFLGIRNAATKYGHMLVGSGQKFEIQYRY